VDSRTEVLDIGCGPGTIALQLASVSSHVTGIDVSQEFLDAAVLLARRQNRQVSFLKRSADELAFQTQTYDVIVAAQAFHWLNPWLASAGLYRSLQRGGSLFVVESKPALPPAHPLRTVFGYGYADDVLVRRQCYQHALRHAQLFQIARQAPDILSIAGVWLFREHRPFDINFARAYLFADQIEAALPSDGDPWSNLSSMMDAQGPEAICGDMYWFVAQFTKVKVGTFSSKLDGAFDQVVDVPHFAGPDL